MTNTKRGAERKPRPIVKRADEEKAARREYAAEVGRRIAWVREAAGLTQQQMTRLIECGSQPAYARWETGTNLADVFSMLRFAARMRVSLDYIYRGSLAGVHPDLAAQLQADHPELRGATTHTDWRRDIAQALRKSAKPQ